MEKSGDTRNMRERKSKTPEQALSSLMRLCSRAEKSSGDAVRLMYRWGVESRFHQSVLQKLVQAGFIDDRRYAEAYTREKTNLGGWGVHKIRRQLKAKGISDTIINEVISGTDVEAGREKLLKMLRKKMQSIRTGSDFEIRAKLFRYGIGLGYDYDDVSAAVENITGENKTYTP